MIFARLRRFCLALVLPCAALAPIQAAPKAPVGDYKSAIVIDAATGQTLFEDNADQVQPPASVTKLMTFLVVYDQLQARRLTLETPVNVTAEAATTGGSQVYLAEKEVFSVEEMLFALMIASANDAATALAIHVAGSKQAFVSLMNAKAAELGMTKTTFRSPHGLPPPGRKFADSDLTTARDLAKLSVHLLAHTDALKYASVEKRIFRPGPKQIAMDNHNNLLGKVPGVDGLKTGFTQGAGFCLAATARRGQQRVVVVTMGSTTSKGRDIRVAELINQGFIKVPASSVFKEHSGGPASTPTLTRAPSLTPAAANPAANAPADAPTVKFEMPPAAKKKN